MDIQPPIDPEVQERLAKLRRLKTLRTDFGIYAYRPHDKQAKFHAAASHKRRYLRTGNRFGKALEDSTPVLTPYGWKEIGSLELNDEVYDRFGRPCKVLAVYPQGEKQLYSFTFDDNLTINACAEHLWICKSPRERWHTGGWVVKSTKDILAHVGEEPSPKQRYVLPLCNPVEFPARDLPLSPYILGCLLGDGSLSTSGVKLTSFDPEIVERCRAELPITSRFNDSAREGHYNLVGAEHMLTAQGTVSSNLVTKTLDRLGLIGTNSYTKFIPSEYLLNSVSNRIALLQGLLDTDGSVYANGKAAEYVSCSGQLTGAVQFILGSLGLTFSTVQRTTRDNNGTPCQSYRILIHKAPSWIFSLTRKAQLLSTLPKSERIIYSIRPDKVAKATCIVVDSPDHSFITKDFIVTHNSTCGAAEDVAFALGARLWLPENSPVRKLGIPSRATKGVILVADWDKAREIFTSPETGKLMKLIPKDRIIDTQKNQAGEVSVILVKNIFGTVSTIELDTIRSYMANPMGQESSQWDWIHVDEPIPKKMWEANARGLSDTNGSAWFTCTPISEQWINEEFLPVKLMKSSFDEGWTRTDDTNFWIMTGSSYDNTNIPREGLDIYARSLDEATRASRIYGLPKSSQGLVYGEFDQDTHVYTDLPKGWKDFDEPPDNYTIRVFIDTHPRTPHAAHFWATSPTGEAFCYQEIWSTCGGLISGLCEVIIEALKGRVPHEILIEPAAFIPNPTDGRCFADVFTEFGLDVEPAPKELATGIKKAKQALGQPNFIHFNSCCTRTLKEFYTYVWDKEKEKPVDKDDHMMECFYRACVVGLEWKDPTTATYDQRDLRFNRERLDLSPFSEGSLKPIAA